MVKVVDGVNYDTGSPIYGSEDEESWDDQTTSGRHTPASDVTTTQGQQTPDDTTMLGQRTPTRSMTGTMTEGQLTPSTSASETLAESTPGVWTPASSAHVTRFGSPDPGELQRAIEMAYPARYTVGACLTASPVPQQAQSPPTMLETIFIAHAELAAIAYDLSGTATPPGLRVPLCGEWSIPARGRVSDKSRQAFREKIIQANQRTNEVLRAALNTLSRRLLLYASSVSTAHTSSLPSSTEQDASLDNVQALPSQVIPHLAAGAYLKLFSGLTGCQQREVEDMIVLDSLSIDTPQPAFKVGENRWKEMRRFGERQIQALDRAGEISPCDDAFRPDVERETWSKMDAAVGRAQVALLVQESHAGPQTGSEDE